MQDIRIFKLDTSKESEAAGRSLELSDSGSKTSVVDSPDRALMRVLNRLGLVDTMELPAGFKSANLDPLQYLAGYGFFNEAEAAQTVADFLGIEFIELSEETTDHIVRVLCTEPCSRVPLSRWIAYKAVPIEENASHILVATANPLDHEIRISLGFELSRPIVLALALEEPILAALDRTANKDQIRDMGRMLKGSKKVKLINTSEPVSAEIGTLEVSKDPEADTIPRLVNKILLFAVKHKASGIHFTSEKECVSVRIRVDGVLRSLIRLTGSVREEVLARIKFLAGMDMSRQGRPQEGRMQITSPQGKTELRVSTTPANHGESIVIRILSQNMSDFRFDALGMPANMQREFSRILSSSSKVHLLTGPTGSGKTCTLYSSIQHLKDGTKSICALEDPIEVQLNGVTQIQVDPKDDYEFVNALRAAMSQDPDVILVGEIRNAVAAELVVQAAQSGKTVLSTLHTNSAPAAITRLLDLGVPPHELASSLGSVIAQRLVRRLCMECAGPLPEEYWAKVAVLGIDPTVVKIPVGCKCCVKSGYSGRIAVFSFLPICQNIREAIREDYSEEALEIVARQSGFMNLHESALRLVSQGITSIREVVRVLGPFDVEEIPLDRVQDKGQPNPSSL